MFPMMFDVVKTNSVDNELLAVVFFGGFRSFVYDNSYFPDLSLKTGCRSLLWPSRHLWLIFLSLGHLKDFSRDQGRFPSFLVIK